MEAREILPPVNNTHEEFLVYEAALCGLNANSPQRQGFLEDEFLDAVTSPSVVKTNAETPVGSTDIPQLCPIDQYSWLNTDFYARKFPEEFKAGTIKHFVEIPGLEPSRDVKQAIVEIGTSNGVLVFDHSEADVDYLARFEAMVEELGMEVEAVEELGTQTYYAGKCYLKRHEDTEGQDDRIADTFKRMKEQGVLLPDSPNGATYHELMSADEASKLYDAYALAFEDLNDHPCRQGIDADEFTVLLTEKPDVIKLVNKKDGEVTTLCVLSDDLTEFEWLNKQFYEKRFPEEAATNELIYFPAIYTDTAKRGELRTKQIVELLTRMSEYGKHEVIVAFDCCDKNKGVLDWYLGRLINKTPELGIDFEVIGTQVYRAARLRPKFVDVA